MSTRALSLAVAQLGVPNEPWFDVQLAKPIIAILASTYMRDAASQVDGVEQVTAVDVNTANFDHTTKQLSGSIEFTTTTQTPIIVEL